MWRLFNYLFDWDYVYWKNSADSGFARVHALPDGRAYYYRYKTTGLIDEIENKNQVLWMTCDPEKYMKNG